MRFSLHQLKHLNVETVSGAMLGHVYEVIFETEGQLVAQYAVKSSLLGKTEYLISRDQVVRFEEKKLIVDDTVRSVTGETKTKPLGISVNPAMIRKEG